MDYQKFDPLSVVCDTKVALVCWGKYCCPYIKFQRTTTVLCLSLRTCGIGMLTTSPYLFPVLLNPHYFKKLYSLTVCYFCIPFRVPRTFIYDPNMRQVFPQADNSASDTLPMLSKMLYFQINSG